MYWCEVVGSGGVIKVCGSWPRFHLYQNMSLRKTSCHQARRDKFSSEDLSSKYLIGGL